MFPRKIINIEKYRPANFSSKTTLYIEMNDYLRIMYCLGFCKTMYNIAEVINKSTALV